MTNFEGDSKDYKAFVKKLLEDEEIVRLLREGLLKDPIKWPSSTKSWLANWLPLELPDIPISQIVGFSNYTIEVATTITTQENRTSATYGALTTAGPSLTGMPAGQYIFFFAFAGTNDTSGKAALMNVSFNGATPGTDNDAAWAANTPGTQNTSAMSFVTQTFTADNNSATAVYRTEAGTGETARFSRRRLAALRIGN